MGSSGLIFSHLNSSFHCGPRSHIAHCMRLSINSKLFDRHRQYHIPRSALEKYGFWTFEYFVSHLSTFALKDRDSESESRSRFFPSLGEGSYPQLALLLYLLLLLVISKAREESTMAIKANGFVKGRLSEELKVIIQSVASQYGDVVEDMDALKMVPLKGAMTNEVYQITWPTKDGDFPRKVLVRVYGEGVDVFFNREDEIRTFECVSRHGQGPRLLSRFAEGRIEEFIHARTLSAADLRDPEISSLIASKLREFHSLEMPFPEEVHLWKTMRKWLNTAKSLCSKKDSKEFGLEGLDEEIKMLERELTSENQEIGFCHNDLQYGNIMMDEETRAITIIDYEYSSYNPVAYDIANHFCEMVADYHSETPHVLDYTKYPDIEERRRFIRTYLSSTGKEPTESELDELLNTVERFTLANHLFWGIWGIISGYVNKIDFDYMEYARQRFQQYRLRKLELLG